MTFDELPDDVKSAVLAGQQPATQPTAAPAVDRGDANADGKISAVESMDTKGKRILSGDASVGEMLIQATPLGMWTTIADMWSGTTDKSKIERYGDATAAEILSLPGAVAGLVGLGEMGGEAIAGTNVEHAALSTEGSQKLAMLEDETVPPEVKAVIADNFSADDLNWGLRNLTANRDWAHNYVGADSYDNHMLPLDEEIAGIIGSAFVGVPRALVSKVGQRIATAAGTNAAGKFALSIASSRVGRATGRALEVATPVTFPLSAGNIAANAGVGIALSDVQRTLIGEDSIINAVRGIQDKPDIDPVKAMQLAGHGRDTQNARQTLPSMAHGNASELDDMERTPWDKYLQLGVGGVATLYVLSALAGRPARAPFSAGNSTRDVDVRNPNNSDIIGGQQLEQLFGTDTGLQIQTRVQDASAPSARAAVLGGMDRNDIDAVIAAQTRSGAEQLVQTAVTTGQLPYKHTTIPRVADLNDQYMRFDNNSRLPSAPVQGVETQRQLANAYIYALDAKKYRDVARAELTQTIGGLQVKQGKQTPGTPAHTRTNAEIQRLTNMMNNDIRMSMTRWSDTDIGRIIAMGNSDPRIQAFKTRVEGVMNGMLSHRQFMGEIDSTSATSWRNRWGNDIVPLSESYLGTAGTTGLWGKVSRANEAVKETVYGKTEEKSSVARLDSPRPTDPDTIEARQQSPQLAVNNPIDVVAALHRMVGQTIRYTEANNARIRIIDQLAGNPNTKDTIRRVGDYSRRQVSSGNLPFSMAEKSHYLPVHRRGRVEFWEFGDDLLRQSLDFAPHSIGGVLNTSRRIYQSLTTGKFAPWFAPKGLLFDVFASTVTKNKGTALGYLDGAVMKAFDGRYHIPGDPTAFLDALINGSGRAFATETFIKNFGDWFANHLSNSNTMFARMMEAGAQAAGVQGGLKAVGEGMLNRYARTSVGVLRNEGGLGNSATWFDNPADKMFDSAGMTFNMAGRTYMTMLESIHNGAKVAMFSRGHAMLKKKYGTRPVPRIEILKLADQVRNISGDMSKTGRSEIVNRITDAMPYSNVTIQSMSHVYGTAARNPMRTGVGLFNGIGIPMITGLLAMSYAGNETLDWYFNKVPGWQRASTIPVPTPSAVQRITNSDYEHDANDWILVPIAPELTPLKEMFSYGVETLFGFRANEQVRDNSIRDLKEALGSVFNIVMPPSVNAAVEGSGYTLDTGNLFTEGRSPIREKPSLRTAAFDDTTSVNSEIHKNTVDAVTALFGTAMQIATNMGTSLTHASADNADFDEAMGSMFGQAAFDIKKRTAVANTAIWGLSSQYAGTPLTEAYYATMNDLTPVFRQFAVETRGMVGNSEGNTRVFGISEMPDKIRNDVDGIPAQLIRQAVVQSHTMFNNPVLEGLTSRMSAIIREKEGVRGNMRANPEERLNKLNELEAERQSVAAVINESFVENWLEQMETAFGEPITARQFTSIVRRSVYGD